MLKRYFILAICIILVFTTAACGKGVTKLVYAEKGVEWYASVEYNTGRVYKFVIKYLGNEKMPIDVKFKIEHLSGNTSGGVGIYTETIDKLGGLTIETKNDDISSGNIRKYGDKDNLSIEIEWNNKTEQIKLLKETES
jgi:hypothetical protein